MVSMDLVVRIPPTRKVDERGLLPRFLHPFLRLLPFLRLHFDHHPAVLCGVWVDGTPCVLLASPRLLLPPGAPSPPAAAAAGLPLEESLPVVLRHPFIQVKRLLFLPLTCPRNVHPTRAAGDSPVRVTRLLHFLSPPLASFSSGLRLVKATFRASQLKDRGGGKKVHFIFRALRVEWRERSIYSQQAGGFPAGGRGGGAAVNHTGLYKPRLLLRSAWVIFADGIGSWKTVAMGTFKRRHVRVLVRKTELESQRSQKLGMTGPLKSNDALGGQMCFKRAGCRDDQLLRQVSISLTALGYDPTCRKREILLQIPPKLITDQRRHSSMVTNPCRKLLSRKPVGASPSKQASGLARTSLRDTAKPAMSIGKGRLGRQPVWKRTT
ncbi:hypothetical protein EYF80_004589 [Liparis tanakae]|uniref:Uncharacterized protein n=1 Tax=Liparis tanakae TaxID=230148 RepID=A0A4Z2J4V9_9TELE|nr:hypothetical protein EYF80_004589 [Liparis tanakae]